GAPKKFWAVASQLKANSLGDVLHTLREKHKDLTVRNIMTYRYLGLLKKEGSEIVQTDAGAAIVAAAPEEQQRLLDMQIAKVWLQNPTNRNMKLDVYPFEVLVQLLLETDRISWDEYQTVVMWIQDSSEVEEALELISDFRKLNEVQRTKLLADTEKRSGSQDLDNQARRLHRAISVHSVLLRDRENGLTLTVAKDVASEYLGNFQRLRDSQSFDYVNFLEMPSDFAPEELLPKPDANQGLDYQDIYLLDPQKKQQVRTITKRARKVDYLAKAKNQLEAGFRAEIKVLESEKLYLKSHDRPDLADKVSHISITDDSAGFDILSFYQDGREKHIEVKGVSNAQGASTIFLSKNEVQKALSDPHWVLVLVMGNGTTKPFLWLAEPLRAAILDANFDSVYSNSNLEIAATQYQISFIVAPLLSSD
ncbi:MAG: hypothetical protein RLZZ400_553, partial [Actinomycetota bacterium]